MIDVIFRAHIHSCFAGISSTDYTVQIKAKMPFPPTVGMTVIISEDVEIPIREDGGTLYYDCENGSYIYWFEDKELYDLHLNNINSLDKIEGRPVEDILEEYLDIGYVLYQDREIERYRKYKETRDRE